MEDALRDALSVRGKDSTTLDNIWNSYIPSTKIG